MLYRCNFYRTKEFDQNKVLPFCNDYNIRYVFGEFNVLDTGGTNNTTRGTYVEIVGKGTGNNARSNARTLDWSGNETLAGSITIGKGTSDEVTLTPAKLKQLLALL